MLPAYFNAAAGTVRKNKNFVFGSTDGAIELPMNVKFPDYKFSRLVFSDFHLSYQPVYRVSRILLYRKVSMRQMY